MKYHNVIYTNWESVVKTIFPDAAFNCTVNCGQAYCLGGRCYMWSYRRLCSYYLCLFLILPLISFVLPYCNNLFICVLLTGISVGCVYQSNLKALLACITVGGRIDNYRWVSLLRSSCLCKNHSFFSTHRTPWEKFVGIHYLLFGKIRKEVRSLKSSKLLKLGGIMKKSLK
jgi:hypothetical protein